jgi:hypothetical protein
VRQSFFRLSPPPLATPSLSPVRGPTVLAALPAVSAAIPACAILFYSPRRPSSPSARTICRNHLFPLLLLFVSDLPPLHSLQCDDLSLSHRCLFLLLPNLHFRECHLLLLVLPLV